MPKITPTKTGFNIQHTTREVWGVDDDDANPQEVTMHTHRLYECGICSCYHPWNWEGDCREDAARFDSIEQYAASVGVDPDDVEVMSWDERAAADGK